MLLDNCAIHKAKVVKAAMTELRITALMNVPYQPSLNGIELVWAMAKANFKQRALGMMVDAVPYETMESLVGTVLQDLDQDRVRRCCLNSLQLIRRYQGVDNC